MPILSGALMLTGCASSSPAVSKLTRKSQSPQSPNHLTCPALADVDTRMLYEKSDRAVAELGPTFERLFADVNVPRHAKTQPPASPPVLIKVKLPPGGLHSNTITSIVWKDDLGQWWYWWRNVGGGPPPEPVIQPDGSFVYPEADPPRTGRLSDMRIRRIEAALSDPCRQFDPAWWPWAVTLKNGTEQTCAPDGTVYLAILEMRGNAPRRIGADCINKTPTYTMISAAAYAGDEAPTQ